MPIVRVTGSNRGIGHATYAWDEDTVVADLSEPSAPQRLWQSALDQLDARLARESAR